MSGRRVLAWPKPDLQRNKTPAEIRAEREKHERSRAGHTLSPRELPSPRLLALAVCSSTLNGAVTGHDARRFSVEGGAPEPSGRARASFMVFALGTIA
jgi:hypothetical protein